MATFQAVVLKGKIHVRNDKKSNIKIRVTHNRKADYISTDLYIYPKHLVHGVAKNDVDASFINDRIRTEIGKYNTRFLKLGPLPEYLTVKELKERLMREDGTYEDIDFMKFADNYLKQLETNKQEGSLRAARGLISNLKKFRTTLSFSQIDYLFLKNFHQFMIKEGVGNGAETYMSRFRVIFNKGREQYNDDDRGIIRISNYPFKKYKIAQPVGNSKDSCLTVEQMKMFILHEPVIDRAKLAKDMFLLQFYLIGINTKDLFFAANPVKGRLRFDRFKTKREYSIKLEPEVIEIIERYKSKKLLIDVYDRYCDHLHFQTAINKGLKIICTSLHQEFEAKRTPEDIANNIELDFPRKITSNWSRHTWATIARNDCEIDKDDVALCLGHEDKDNVVTDMYIRYDYSIIDRCNRKVIDLVFSIPEPVEGKKPIDGRTSKKNTKRLIGNLISSAVIILIAAVIYLIVYLILGV